MIHLLPDVVNIKQKERGENIKWHTPVLACTLAHARMHADKDACMHASTLRYWSWQAHAYTTKKRGTCFVCLQLQSTLHLFLFKTNKKKTFQGLRSWVKLLSTWFKTKNTFCSYLFYGFHVFLLVSQEALEVVHFSPTFTQKSLIGQELFFLTCQKLPASSPLANLFFITPQQFGKLFLYWMSC